MLIKSLDLMKSVLERKSALPITRCFYIERDGNDTLIKATNLEVMSVCRLKNQMITFNPVLVDGDKLIKALKTTKLESILVSNEHLVIKDGKKEVKLPLVEDEFVDFPKIPEFTISLPSSIIYPVISVAEKVLPDNDVGYSLGYIYINGNEIAISDGRRLMLVKSRITLTNEPVFIHKRAVKILKQISNVAVNLDIGKDDTYLYISSPDIANVYGFEFVLIMRLPETFGYPDYHAVIPEKEKIKTSIKIQLADLREEVRSMRKLGLLSCKINVGDKGITINSMEDGIEYKANLDCEVDGESLELGISVQYLSDCLETFDDETINIDFVDEESPVLVYGNESEEDDYRKLWVIMPMRI